MPTRCLSQNKMPRGKFGKLSAMTFPALQIPSLKGQAEALDNTPAHGDFARYVDDLLSVHEQKKPGQSLPTLHAQMPKAKATSTTTTTPAARPALAPKAEGNFPAKADNKAAAKNSATDDDDEKLDAWEAKWQPVFMFIRNNLGLLIGLGFAWYAMVALLRELLAFAFEMPQISSDNWFLRFVPDSYEFIVPLVIVSTIAFVILLSKVVQRFKAMLLTHTAYQTPVWLVLIGLAALEFFIAKSGKVSGLLLLFFMAYGGASGGLWKVVRIIRREAKQLKLLLDQTR